MTDVLGIERPAPIERGCGNKGIGYYQTVAQVVGLHESVGVLRDQIGHWENQVRKKELAQQIKFSPVPATFREFHR